MKKLILLLTFTFLTALSFAGGNVPVKSFTLSGLNQFSGNQHRSFTYREGLQVLPPRMPDLELEWFFVKQRH